jgi:predicted nucleic acid-binding protein
MSGALLLDAGPLIHLDELGCLRLFATLGELLIPVEVWTEARRHRSGLRIEDLPLARLLDAAPPPSAQLREKLRHFDLDEGESAALSWLEALHGGMLVSDDGQARDAATELNFAVIGTLGIIIRASRRGFISTAQARQFFGRLRTDTTLHVSANLLATLLDLLPEA